MHITGIICEYNPFHAGHAHMLEMVRNRRPDTRILCLMSTCFTQRGEAACLPVDLRVRMALSQGADAVVAFPFVCAVRGAEDFALSGVRILDAMGCHALAFGAEEPSLPRLASMAGHLEHPGKEQTDMLHAFLNRGFSWARAMEKSMESTVGGEAQLLRSPNNILALNYLRSLERLGSSMEPLLIHRSTSYRNTGMDEPFPSARAIRACLEEGNYAQAFQALPVQARPWLRLGVEQGRLVRKNALDAALFYRLRTMSPEAYGNLPESGEGTGDLLRKMQARSGDREQLLALCTSARYPASRFSRLCAYALVQVSREDLPVSAPREVWLLGCRENAEPLISRIGRNLKEKGGTLLGSASRCDSSWMHVEERAWDLHALACGDAPGAARRYRVQRP